MEDMRSLDYGSYALFLRSSFHRVPKVPFSSHRQCEKYFGFLNSLMLGSSAHRQLLDIAT